MKILLVTIEAASTPLGEVRGGGLAHEAQRADHRLHVGDREARFVGEVDAAYPCVLVGPPATGNTWRTTGCTEAVHSLAWLVGESNPRNRAFSLLLAPCSGRNPCPL